MNTYEKKYKEANDKVAARFGTNVAKEIFTDLYESEDEKIRNWLIGYFHQYKEDGMEKYANGLKVESIIAWLEKQGEKKQDVRYENLEELLVADDIYQMAMNDEMVQEAKEKAINALSEMCIGRLLGVEKQGKQKVSYTTLVETGNGGINALVTEELPSDKVEPKFKVGDWISGYYTSYQVLSINNEGYVVEDVGGNKINILFENEKFHHLWTIKDAKDGDALSDGTTIFIFKDLLSDGSVMSYCDYDTDSGESDAFCPLSVNLMCSKITPTTKEQRDLLFQKMHEARYMWDSEKKELKNIEQNSAWSEEDETSIAINNPEAYRIGFTDGKAHAKEEMALTWSEDDKKHIIDIIDYLDDYYSFAKDEYEDVADGVQNEIRWLQRIKERL